MFVDQRILEDLCRDAGATRKDKAIKYQKQGKVEIRKLDYKNNKNFDVSTHLQQCLKLLIIHNMWDKLWIMIVKLKK